MSSSYLMNLLASAVAVIVGIVIHESAHAAAAWALGDKTARSRGRVSLNPLNHIDPFGTIILPLLMLAAGGPVFAFAKPVPVYLNNLKHPKRDEVLVSVAGPASNIALACLAAALMHATYGNLYTSMSFAVASQIMNFGATFIVVNLSLAFFNLIPIPRIVDYRAVPQGQGTRQLLSSAAIRHAYPHHCAVPAAHVDRHRRDRPLFRRYRVSASRVAAQLRNRRHLR